MTSMRELWFLAPHDVVVRTGGVSSPLETGEVRARALASAISQGTELLLYRGEGPTPFDPSLDSPGTPTYPRRYGYAWVGEVIESRAEGAPPGSRVFALATHGDEHVLARNGLRFVPPSIAPERATLAANLETALTVVWDAEIALGDDVVILGGGIVGLLCGFLARASGAARTRLVEPSARRREAALALGMDEALSPEEDQPNGRADVVIEATGTPTCLDQAILHAGQDATVVVASFYGERKSAVALGQAFHRRRIQLKSSQVSRLPPKKTARWDAARRFDLVLRWLADSRLDALLDRPISFDEAPRAYAMLAANPGSSLQVVFHY